MTETTIARGAVEIRSTHPHAFRSGEWGLIVGVTWAHWMTGRPAFIVRWPEREGVTGPLATEDIWLLERDDAKSYEFRPATSRIPDPDWHNRPVTVGVLSDALAGAVDAVRQHIDKMAPAAMGGAARAASLPTQDEGVEPGPSGDDQPASPVPSHLLDRIRTLESHLVDQRQRIAQLEHDLRLVTQREGL